MITNPSVTESTSGAGGVINVVTKKRSGDALSLSLNAGGGNDSWYHLSPGISYRVKDVNLFLNYTYRNMKRLSENSSHRQQTGDSIRYLDQHQTGVRLDRRHNAELGLDYYVSDNKYFTFSGNYRSRDKKDDQERVISLKDENLYFNP